MALYVNHTAWNTLLQRYVEDGTVDYAGIAEDELLPQYIEVLSKTKPDQLDPNEALTFWINAYNAFTVKLVADHYPVKSILDITPIRIKGLRLALPRLNTPFKMDVATIHGVSYTLDAIEHDVLRKDFQEPRIHFAIVCASIGCPPLRSEAYVPSRIDAQLDEQARIFLQNASWNQFDPTHNILYLSKIFKWFEKDFGASKPELIAFIKPFLEKEIRSSIRGNTRIRYLKYNWNLNQSVVKSGD